MLYLIQNVFTKNKESRTISLNSQYMVVFKNPRDASQMSHLARQMYPGRVKFVQDALKDATSIPVRLSKGRSQTGHARGYARPSHDHLSRRRCIVLVPTEGIRRPRVWFVSSFAQCLTS